MHQATDLTIPEGMTEGGELVEVVIQVLVGEDMVVLVDMVVLFHQTTQIMIKITTQMAIEKEIDLEMLKILPMAQMSFVKIKNAFYKTKIVFHVPDYASLHFLLQRIH